MAVNRWSSGCKASYCLETPSMRPDSRMAGGGRAPQPMSQVFSMLPVVRDGILWARLCANYAEGMAVSVAETRQLIGILVADTRLPRHVRRKAAALESLVLISPELVSDRLNEIREAALLDLGVELPNIDYARCVSVEVFYDHHIQSARKQFFRDPEDYLLYLESLANPAETARRHIKQDPILLPAAYSWLIPAHNIADLRGPSIKSRLQLHQDPPYIVMVFPVERMRAADVGVREPRGIDVVPSYLTWWSPKAVPGERIDQDIPLSALGGLEWKP